MGETFEESNIFDASLSIWKGIKANKGTLGSYFSVWYNFECMMIFCERKKRKLKFFHITDIKDKSFFVSM